MVVGNKTEGALMNLIRMWGYNCETVKQEIYNEKTDKIFPFDSLKKRATAVVFYEDGCVRLYCKGATEILLENCTKYTDEKGDVKSMDKDVKKVLNEKINHMAQRALRTLMLSHIDYSSAAELPKDWKVSPPDEGDLICDAIVGIIGEICDGYIDILFVNNSNKSHITLKI